jgi:hypothetical protein
MRQRLAWGVALPLAVAGTQAAHAIAYALVYPEASLRGAALATTGHSYFAWLPFVLGVSAACALLSLGGAVIAAARGRNAQVAPAWVFGLLAPTVFVLQEVIELSLHMGTLGWRAVLAPTFLPGLALQLPFALAAYLVARLLLRAATAFGRALAAPQPQRLIAVYGLRPSVQLRAVLLRSVTARGPPRVVGI